jgi:hypothetical protein
VSASIGGFNASVKLGDSLNGSPAGGLFDQAVTPEVISVSAGLQDTAGPGEGLKSQAHVVTAKESSENSSAGAENHTPSSNGRPDTFYDNVFNVSRSLCSMFKL